MFVLSLSGGGYKGIYTARVLDHLERRAGPLDRCVDLACGTSIGAVIAMGIACGNSAADVCEAFRWWGPRIFTRRSRFLSPFVTAQGFVHLIRRPKYDGRALEACFRDIFGDRRMEDLRFAVVVNTVRLRDAHPCAFSSESHPHLSLVDMAMAAAAAPTYLPPRLLEDEIHVDGALYANSPDMIALHQAEIRGARRSDMVMASIGAMNRMPDLGPVDCDAMGLLGWLRHSRMLNASLSAQSTLSMRMAQDALGERFVRIDAPACGPHTAIVGLDVATPEATRIMLDTADADAPRVQDILDLLDGMERGPSLFTSS